MSEPAPSRVQAIARKLRAGDRWWVRLVMALVCVGTLSQCYYGGQMRQVTAVGDYYDLTYYYLNSKYFPELGYTRLYEAMLVADDEGPKRFSNIKRYRNLHHYRNVSVRHAFERPDRVKKYFSTPRWEAFKVDVDFLSRQRVNGGWAYFFKDHGYNPPPTWTFVGATLSSAVDLQDAKRITSVDLVLIIVMFALIGWAFGFWATILSLLFFSLTLSGLWPKAGQALLRFDWLACSVAAFCMAHKGRYRWAGGLIAYAACMRIFPAVFAFPFIVEGVREVVVKGRMSARTREILVGALVVVSVVAGGALVRYGPDSFRDAAAKIALHAGPDSYSSHRVGLGDAMVFHGETTRKEMNQNGGTLGKAEQIKNRSLYIRFLGLLFMAFVAALCWTRYRERAYLAMPLCVGIVFVLTTPQINYFNMRLLLILWAFADPHRLRTPLTLLGLALIEIVGTAFDGTVERYFVTSVTSVMLLAYFATIAASFAYERFFSTPRPEETGWRKMLLALPVVLLVPHFMHNDEAVLAQPKHDATAASKTRPVAKPVDPKNAQVTDPARLLTEQVSGGKWNGPDCVVIPKQGIALTWNAPQNAPAVRVSLDGNDTYTFAFFLGDAKLGERMVAAPEGRHRGLRLVTIAPPDAARAGFDRVVVGGQGGDRRYSIGHFILEDAGAPAPPQPDGGPGGQ